MREIELIKSDLLNKYDEIIFGFSTKIGLDRTAPFYFNMSLNVGDDPEFVLENRDKFLAELGINPENTVFQLQTHSDNISYVNSPGTIDNNDAIVTDKPGLALIGSSADCPLIALYDKNKMIISIVHSGWRGTEKKILRKTLDKLINDFNSDPNDIIAHISPSVCSGNYEVGQEVAELFNSKYSIPNKNGKFFLDVKKANYDMLLDVGIPKENIDVSTLCSFEETNLLHSYRREGKESGRAIGVIALR